MPTVDQSKSLYRLPASLAADLEQLRENAGQFKSGILAAPRFQAFRVPLGIYEQRDAGTYMVRVRLPAGQFLPDQMRAVADIAERFGDGQLHLTSRQDVQIHRVSVENLYRASKALAEAGLSTKGGGGNTVRNIAACPLAGVCPAEAFDVTPHVVSLTESLLPDPLSFQLPRKYKIAFSGCSADCAAATVNDLGYIAKSQGGIDGFAVYVGGGMGNQNSVGQRLGDFVPASDVYRVGEAVKRVFDQHGNRKNRHRARIRFLLEELGPEKFRELYLGKLQEIPAAPIQTKPVAPDNGHSEPPADTCRRWKNTGILPQKQETYFAVRIAVPLGIVTASQLRQIAEIVAKYGEKRARATSGQDLVLRWVGQDELESLKGELAAIGFSPDHLTRLRNLIACAGAATCRLGICLSRGLAEAIQSVASTSGLDLAGPAGAVSVHISGCPNACGRHPVAEIGLFGAARRVHGRLVPHYTLQLGGRVREGGTVLAETAATLPARQIPAVLVELLRAYQESPHYGDFWAFLENGGRAVAAGIAVKHSDVSPYDEDPVSYQDWGMTSAFSLAGRGPGECGAGVFDLIEVDLASAQEAFSAGRLHAATILASRALLVTRGEQADSDAAALTLFQRLFVVPGSVDAAVAPLIERAIASLEGPDPNAAFVAQPAEVGELITQIQNLYATMGPSLRTPVSCPGGSCTPTPSIPAPADAKADFRGVTCPLNYVKTKMTLARLRPGQVLEVLLDQQGAANVPASAAADGHEVITCVRDQEHWRVQIKRKGD